MLAITQESLGQLWGKSGNYIYMLEAGKKPFPKKLELRVLQLEKEVRQKLDAHPHLDPSGTDFLVLKEGPIQLDALTAPVVSWPTVASDKNFVEVAQPTHEKIPTDCRDPNKYALIVEDDSMSPKIEPGDRIVVAANSNAANGDVVVAVLKERGSYLRLYHENRGLVSLTSFNPAYPALEYRLPEFRFIHPVYALIRKLRAKSKI